MFEQSLMDSYTAAHLGDHAAAKAAARRAAHEATNPEQRARAARRLASL